MRCLALAEALEATRGWHCGFASSPETRAIVPSIDNLAFKPIELVCPAENEAEELVKGLPDGCDLLVVDHYQRDERFEQACRPWAKRIMVIDDLADRKHDCNFLLDQTLGRKAADYDVFVPIDCKLFLGPDYALLRPQFFASRKRSLEYRKYNEDIKRILISFGGGEMAHLTKRTLDGLAKAQFTGHVDVILGIQSQRLDIVFSKANMLNFSVMTHAAVEDMAELMAEADLAIGGGGTSSWERCSLGLPTLIVVIATNQQMIATELENAGAALMLGWHEFVEAETIVDSFTELTSTCGLLAAMAEKAAAVCDGQGIGRVTEAIAA